MAQYQNNRLNGVNALAYLGVNATQPPQIITASIAPSINDKQFPLGTIWIEGVGASATAYIYMGVNATNGQALWPLFTSSSTGDVLSLTGNSGGAIAPDGSGNINVVGATASGINVVGSGHTLTISNTNRTDAKITTVDNTPTALASQTIPTNSSILVTASVLGTKSDYSNSMGTVITRAAFRAGAGASVAGATVQQALCSSAPIGVTADITLVGNTMTLVVTGEAATTYNWVGTFEYITLP